MGLRDDAAKERTEAVEALKRVLASIEDVQRRLLHGESAATVLRLWGQLKHGPDMLAAVGSMSRCNEFEGAARAVEAAERQEAAQRAQWMASERRFERTYSSRVWDAKTLAAGGGNDD